MCGESARTRRSASSRVGEVELAVVGGDLLGVGRAVLGCGAEPRLGQHVVEQLDRDLGGLREDGAARPRRPETRAARDRARVELLDRLVDRHARLSSPAMIARSTGAAPRQRGSSDGWTFSQSAAREQRLRDQQPVGGDDDRVGAAARPSRRAAPAAAPGCRAARRPAFAGGGAELAARGPSAGRGASAGRRRRSAPASRSRTSAPNGAVAATPSRRLPSDEDRLRPQLRHRLLAALGIGAVDDQHAVEVVELVLDDARRQPLELEPQLLAVEVACPRA